jgi:hypothetical protein
MNQGPNRPPFFQNQHQGAIFRATEEGLSSNSINNAGAKTRISTDIIIRGSRAEENKTREITTRTKI